MPSQLSWVGDRELDQFIGLYHNPLVTEKQDEHLTGREKDTATVDVTPNNRLLNGGGGGSALGWTGASLVVT